MCKHIRIEFLKHILRTRISSAHYSKQRALQSGHDKLSIITHETYFKELLKAFIGSLKNVDKFDRSVFQVVCFCFSLRKKRSVSSLDSVFLIRKTYKYEENLKMIMYV